jgi:uncharacterized protein YjlB
MTMPILEDLKEYTERATGVRRPGTLNAGDVVILPAGTGHQRLSASGDFLVVGGYPPSGTYDECTSLEGPLRALRSIPKVALPRKDPVYGAAGPLSKLRKKAK